MTYFLCRVPFAKDFEAFILTHTYYVPENSCTIPIIFKPFKNRYSINLSPNFKGKSEIRAIRHHTKHKIDPRCHSPSSFFFYLWRYGLRKRHFRVEGVVIAPWALKRCSGDNRIYCSRISPTTRSIAIKIENFNSILSFFMFLFSRLCFYTFALFFIYCFFGVLCIYFALKSGEERLLRDSFVGRILHQWYKMLFSLIFLRRKSYFCLRYLGSYKSNQM